MALTVRELLKELSDYDMETEVVINVTGTVSDIQEFPPSARERDCEVEIDFDELCYDVESYGDMQIPIKGSSRKRTVLCLHAGI